MKGWEKDKNWSDRFVIQIKRILGEHLIGPAPEEEDNERNTDLIVLKMEPVRIACRIRRNEYREKYEHEFTVRTFRPSGAKTELAKIIEGWGNYFFYGFANDNATALCSWSLVDLNVFRLWFSRRIIKNKGVMPGRGNINKDNSSYFRAFDFNDFPK